MNLKKAVIFAALLPGLSPFATFAANPPVRIWPLGDSITEGCCLSIGGAYRTELYNQLTSAGYNVDDVGTLVDLHPPPTLPDIDHEGHDGWRIDEIDAGIDSWAGVTDDPDLILLHIGTNDFAQNHDTTNAIHRLEALVEHLATLHPYARIIVASLLVAANPAINDAEQTTYNALIPGVVAHQVSLGRRVSFVDMHSCCSVSDLSDQINGLHPTTAGYAKMASKWFTAVTGAISPLGSPEPPAVLRVSGAFDLKHVSVTFSKPVADAAAVPGNFTLSGGLSVSQAVLDSSKRVMTLTTSPQSPATSYSLSISGVQDRTTPAHTIASGSSALFQSAPVAEAANYSLVYSLRLPNQVNYNTAGVSYDIDNHSSIGPFRRVAYYLELQPSGEPAQYLWVSMDAFTTDPGKIGVPTIQSGAFFQQRISNLNVRSSVPGIVTGDNLTGGNIEFWWGNYGKSNSSGVPGASDTLYDFGDSASPSSPAGYGSMQVHNWAAGQTVFSYSGWGEADQNSDLGIGINPGTYPDWTLAQNAASYDFKRLQVYVLPAGGVVAEHVFYNHSAWDNNDPAPNADDDNAIAPDKIPLRRGGIATFANYTSFSRGLNGVMVDIASLPGTPTAADFSFKLGNNNNPATWTNAPAPTSVTVRHGAGVSGSDRVTLIWPDNTIQKQWLELTVLPTPNTGLSSADIFYFGNAVGESGNSRTDARVNPADGLMAQAHPRTALDPAPIDSPYDYNRDKLVDRTDQSIALLNQTGIINALRLLNLSGLGPAALPPGLPHGPSLKAADLQPDGLMNPVAADSAAPVVTSVGSGKLTITLAVQNKVVLDLFHEPGQFFQLEFTDQLTTGGWTRVDALPMPSSDGRFCRWALPLESASHRFYRIHEY